MLFILPCKMLFAQRVIASGDSIKEKSTKHNRKKVYPFGMNSTRDNAQNLDSSRQYHRFYTWVVQAGLLPNMRVRGPVTLFMPDTGAINKMPKTKIDSLLSQPGHYELINLITYHTIRGRIKVKNIKKSIRQGKGTGSFTSISGGIIKARFNKNGDIILIDETGGESVLSPIELNTINGILHPVDHVLIPKKKDI